MATNPLNIAARMLLNAACSLAPFLFILSLPWNDLGLWSQVETATVGLHAISAVAALGLALLVASGNGTARAAVTSKPIMVLAGLGMLGIALAPFVPEPWRSVHGTLKHGIGALWHIELAVLAASYTVIRGSTGAKFALACTMAAALAMLSLYVVRTGFGVPLSFAEWVGIMAAVTGAAAMARSTRLAVIAVPILVSGYLVSENRAILLAYAAVAVIWAASRVPRLSKYIDHPRLGAIVPVMIAVTGILGLWVAAPVVEWVATRDVVVDTARIPSANPIDHVRVQEGAAGTLWSRSYMIRVATNSSFKDPVRALLGQGWGGFHSLSVGALRDVPGRMMEKGQDTASLAYWDVNEKANFHSHNIPVEAYISLGLPGLMLWLVFLWVLAASSRAGLYLSVGIAIVGTFWFPVNLLTPMLALAISESLPRTGVQDGGEEVTPATAVGAILLLVTAAAAMLSALVLFGLSRIEHKERYFLGVEVPKDVRTCAAVTSPFAPHLEVNADLYHMLERRIRKASDPVRELVDRTTNILSFSCVMRRYWMERGSTLALAASLEIRTKLLAVSRAAAPILVNDIVKWGEDVDAMLDAAPGRTEFAVPYVADMRLRGVDGARIATEARRLSGRMVETDPVKHWLLFVAEDEAGNAPEGQRHLLRALELGFANLFPVAPESLPKG